MSNTGKIPLFVLCACLLLSCDRSVPLSIGNGRTVQVSTDCGDITLNGSRFGGSVFFRQKFEGAFWVHPGSLKIEFLPKSVELKNLTFTVGDDQRNNNNSFQVSNSYISVNVDLFSPTPIDLDTVTMMVLPCNYLMCNNQSLLEDTIRISLNAHH